MVFIESRWFTRRLLELAGQTADDVLRGLQEELRSSPQRGAVVPGLGGVRKVRVAMHQRAKGKRGGLRAFYYYIEWRQHIYLLFLISKNEQQDLTREQRELIRTLVENLKAN